MVRARRYAEAEVPLRRAMALLDALRAAAPDTEAAHAALYERYRCCELLGLYLEREEAFARYVQTLRERDGDEAAARALLVDACRLVRSRDFDGSRTRAEGALALCPTGSLAVEAHLAMASGTERAGLREFACSEYELALAQGPPPSTAARIHRAVISTAAGKGDIDLALAHGEKLCSLPETDIPPRERVIHHWLLARLYARKGRTGDAIGLLRAVVSRYDPQYAELASLELGRMVEESIRTDALK